ncbi:MAG: alpha/beta hydrolase [Rhodococcus sp. (in: high G+C Gram-positive bacteria)]|uniref:alpha/beta fold hydrolase n=1 Tax=Rhodococcus sp. TaxID=1831 RepID=UPI003BAFC9CE
MTRPEDADTRGSFLRVRGVDLYYEETGGAGEPILFLHGFFFDGRMYEAQVAALKDRYRCVSVDLRGQGRSGHARGGYQLEQHTADVLSVIRQLGLAPVHLVGWSMGGFVGLRLAAREPGLLRSLILLDTSATAQELSKLPKHLIVTGLIRLLGASPSFVLNGIETEMYSEGFRTDPGRAGEREVWRRRWAAADRSCLAKTSLALMIRPDIRDELAGVDVPTLIVTGLEDAAMPAEPSRELHSLIAGSRLVELQGVGHSSPVEDPNGVTEALERFLGEVTSSSQ